jgi:hypothetical protein
MKSENKSTTLHYYSMIEGIQGASPLIYIWGAGHPTMAIVNLLLLTNECQQRSSTYYALGVAHNTSSILQLSPRSLRLHIGMCSRRSLNGLILSANARFHPSCCSTKITCPVPLCNSPFYVHSWLPCHEHYLSVPSSLSWWLPTTTAK